MIQCNPMFGGAGRTRDGVKVFTRFSMAYVEESTNKIFSEIPEGRETADFASLGSGESAGMVRCDQTGVLYETAHDVEDAQFTYTEVFPDEDSVCEYIYSTVTGGGRIVRLNTDLYPTWKAADTYAEGDIVVYNGMEYISDFDDNTGNTPNLWGWSYYLPYVEKREIHYVTLAERYPEGDE